MRCCSGAEWRWDVDNEVRYYRVDATGVNAACALCPDADRQQLGVGLGLVIREDLVASTFVCGECVSSLVTALSCGAVSREVDVAEDVAERLRHAHERGAPGTLQQLAEPTPGDAAQAVSALLSMAESVRLRSSAPDYAHCAAEMRGKAEALERVIAWLATMAVVEAPDRESN
jgi:hypothetical protein